MPFIYHYVNTMHVSEVLQLDLSSTLTFFLNIQTSFVSTSKCKCVIFYFVSSA